MQSLPHQQETVAAANRLIDQANKLAAPVIRAKLTTGLEFATRLTALNASQLAAMSEEAARHTRSSQYRVSSIMINGSYACLYNWVGKLSYSR